MQENEYTENEVARSEVQEDTGVQEEVVANKEVLPQESNESAEDNAVLKNEENEEEKSAEKEQADAKKKSKKAVKDTAASMGRTILSYIDRGVEASKKGFKSAGNAISDFGDKSVLRIELSQLKAKKAKALNELGVYTYTAIVEQNEINVHDETFVHIIDSLKKVSEDIEKHETALGE